MLNTLDYFLTIDIKALATILQVQLVTIDYPQGLLESYFWYLDTMAMIYLIALFTLPYLRKSK